MSENEVTEMIFPPVINGHAVCPGVVVSYEGDPIMDPEIISEHFEQYDAHALSAYYAENVATVDTFNFIVPGNQAIQSIAMQADTQFRSRGLKKRLAIVGFANTKMDAPYNDPTWEIWGLNDLHGIIPKWTRWFDIHTPDVIDIDVTAGRAPPDKCGIGGLSHLTCPVYMQERNPKVPNSVQFPLAEILNTFSNLSGKRYFTNSISFMLAYALYEGILTGHQWDEIHIYGVDMAVGCEYVDQRASCEYWIGIAEGMGVKMHIPDASDLCHARFLYAFETKKQLQWDTKQNNQIKSIQERLVNINAAIEANMRAKYQHEGALGYAMESQKTWSDLGTKFPTS